MPSLLLISGDFRHGEWHERGQSKRDGLAKNTQKEVSGTPALGALRNAEIYDSASLIRMYRQLIIASAGISRCSRHGHGSIMAPFLRNRGPLSALSVAVDQQQHQLVERRCLQKARDEAFTSLR